MSLYIELTTPGAFARKCRQFILHVMGSESIARLLLPKIVRDGPLVQGMGEDRPPAWKPSQYKDTTMPLYEHVFITRQDISGAQAEGMIEQFGAIITENGGTVIGHEYWGLRPMAYKINKNRKGHYAMMRLDAPSAAVQEMERQMRLNDNVMRTVSFKVEEHEEGPSQMMQGKTARDERRGSRPPRDDKPREERKEAAADAPAEKAADAAPKEEAAKEEAS